MAQVASYDFVAGSGYALEWTTAGKVRTIGDPWDVFLSFVEPSIPDPITVTWEQLAGSSAPWLVRGTFSEPVRYHQLLLAPTTYLITPPEGGRRPRILGVSAENTTAPNYVTLEIDEPLQGGAYGIEILAVEPLPEEDE